MQGSNATFWGRLLRYRHSEVWRPLKRTRGNLSYDNDNSVSRNQTLQRLLHHFRTQMSIKKTATKPHCGLDGEKPSTKTNGKPVEAVSTSSCSDSTSHKKHIIYTNKLSYKKSFLFFSIFSAIASCVFAVNLQDQVALESHVEKVCRTKF